MTIDMRMAIRFCELPSIACSLCRSFIHSFSHSREGQAYKAGNAGWGTSGISRNACDWSGRTLVGRKINLLSTGPLKFLFWNSDELQSKIWMWN